MTYETPRRPYDMLTSEGVLQLAEEVGVDVFAHRLMSDQNGAMRELVDRYYPDSWMFGDDTPGRVNSRELTTASYVVTCSTPAEFALAYALKPSGVEATITLDMKSTEL